MTKLVELLITEKLTEFKEGIVQKLNEKRDGLFLEQRDALVDRIFNEEYAEEIVAEASEDGEPAPLA